jgi:hypothetical protein
MALVFISIGLLLLALSLVTGEQFINTTRDVIVAFMATNLAEHLAKSIASLGKKNGK